MHRLLHSLSFLTRMHLKSRLHFQSFGELPSKPTLGVNYLIKSFPVSEKDKLLNWWWFDEAVADKVGDGADDENGTLLGYVSLWMLSLEPP